MDSEHTETTESTPEIETPETTSEAPVGTNPPVDVNDSTEGAQ